MKIGILALQGAFIEHKYTLDALHIESFEIRQKMDIQTEFDGLIIPGGESTVMGKLLHDLELFDPVKELIAQGLPVFGTCAGLLLLAKEIENDDKSHLATMDIVAMRNAYGRQLGSFTIEETFQGIGKIPMTFIRAPYIELVQNDTEVLATVNRKIVAAKQKNQLVTAFHPELIQDTSVHKYFIEMILGIHS
jgi:5'-phosphate synthase pdxT subunit